MDPIRPRSFRIDQLPSPETSSSTAAADRGKTPPNNPPIRREPSTEHIQKQLSNEGVKNIKAEPIHKDSGKISLGERNYAGHGEPENLDLGDRNYASHSGNGSSQAAKKIDSHSPTSSNTADTKKTGPSISPTATSPSTAIPNPSGGKASSTNTNNQTLADSKIKFGTSERNQFLKNLNSDAIKLVNQHKLTKDEAAAIHAYTRDEYYPDINKQFRALPLADVDISNAQALQKAGVKNQDLAELIAALVRGMQKLPPTQTDETYFKSLGRNVTMPDNEFKNYEEGEEVSISAFLSTTESADEMVTNHWWDNKDHAVFIHQSVNGNGRDISSFSKFSKEKEILFLPNTKFKVTFKGEPTLTEPGISSSGNALNNDAGKKVKKVLIALQEIPSKQQPLADTKVDSSKAQTSANKTKEKDKSEKIGTYFGIR